MCVISLAVQAQIMLEKVGLEYQLHPFPPLRFWMNDNHIKCQFSHCKMGITSRPYRVVIKIKGS